MGEDIFHYKRAKDTDHHKGCFEGVRSSEVPEMAAHRCSTIEDIESLEYVRWRRYL